MPPSVTLKANVVPADWLARSDDFEARLMRAGLHGTAVVEAPVDNAWGAARSPPLDKLAGALASSPEVGALVARVLVERGGCKLSRALRTNCAMPLPPDARDGGILLSILLARAVLRHDDRRIRVDVLRTLGDEGAAVADALQAAIDKGASRTAVFDAKAWLADVDRLTAAMDRAEVARSLTPASPQVVVDEWARSPLASTKAVAQVAPAEGGDERLPLSGLLSVASFGASPALDIVARELGGRGGLDDGGAVGVAGFVARSRAENGLGRALRAQLRADARRDDPAVQAAALIALLSSYAHGDAIDWDRFTRDFPVVGRAVKQGLLDAQELGAPARPNYPFQARIVEELHAGLPPQRARPLIDALVRDGGRPLIPRRLDALDAVKDDVDGTALLGRGIVAVQHLFPTIVPLIEALIEKGAKPDDIWLLGTPYASNPLVAAYLRTLGVHVMEARDGGGNTRAFEQARVAEVHAFLAEVALAGSAPPRGWKLLDDGGMLQTIIAGHKPAPAGGVDPAKLRKLFDPARTDAVEQTTRGLTELAKHDLVYKTVNIPGAAAKRREGEVIGWSLAEAFVLETTQSGRRGEMDVVGVVGVGTVGLAAARHLKDAGYVVGAVDTDEKRRAAATALGMKATDALDAATVRQLDAILSCTGKTALRGDVLAQYRGTVASGSSAAIELDPVEIDSHRAEPTAVMNRARPLNFRGDGYENLTPANIGMTRALIFVALTQDLADVASPQLVDLDVERSARVEEAWERSGGAKTPALGRTAGYTELARRPDLHGAPARHDEWMAYLARLPFPVCPPPNTVGERPGVYVFSSGNEVRIVDTGAPRSVSTTIDLPDVPRRMTPIEEPETVGWLAEGGIDTHEWFSFVNMEREGFAASAAQPHDRRVVAHVESDPRYHPSFGPHRARRFVFERGDKLLVSFRGERAVHEMQRRTRGEALYIAQGEQVFLELGLSPPSLHVHDPIGHSAVARHLARATLPPDLASIEAVVPLPSTMEPLVIGRTRDGRLIAFPIVPGGGVHAVRLPADAVFRGVHRPDPDQPLSYALDYTLPGDPVEIESLRSVSLTFTSP